MNYLPTVTVPHVQVHTLCKKCIFYQNVSALQFASIRTLKYKHVCTDTCTSVGTERLIGAVSLTVNHSSTTLPLHA